MRTPGDLGEWAARKYRAGFGSWVGSVALGADVRLTYPLQPPTAERAAAGLDATAAWVSEWTRWRPPTDVAVEWTDRAWPTLGRQRLPARVVVEGVAGVARLAGQHAHWRRLVERVVGIRNRWPDAVALDEALPTVARRLGLLSDDDASRTVEVVAWLVDHPSSGRHVRELPVVGITTKWAERHQDLCRVLKAAVTGDGDLGLVRPRTRYRVRVLDERLRPSGLADFSAPASELVRLPLRPATVIVVENLTTVAAMPALAATVAVHGYGQAVGDLAEVGWVRNSRVLYWGDLDTWGFRILGSLRQRLPHVESVLMDDDAIDAGLEMTVDPGESWLGEITHLTARESRALGRLRAEGLKIEQERLDWRYALARIRGALGDAAGTADAAGGQT